MLEENIKQVTGEIGGRATLVAVSKTVPAEVMNRAAECGITYFGENYASELCDKYEFLNNNKIKLHFIGHLQTNKVKYIVDKVCMIQSVDSLRLAAEIDRQCGKIGKVLDVLMQVNIGCEKQKGGVDKNGAETLAGQISQLQNIRLKGLMAIPPADEDPQVYFCEMKCLFDRLAEAGFDMQYLSMGMSADYMQAVNCGANMVRVGTKIFGARNYSKR